MFETAYQRYRKAVADGRQDPLSGADRNVYKQFDVVVEAASAERQLKFVVTTATPDRENDVLVTTGVDTANYERNPVVMWAHDYRQMPVGRCVAIMRTPTMMTATVEFATADLNPFAEQVYRMVKAGFIKACSIGFRPTKWQYNDDRGGVDFEAAEMLEFSICPIPANAEALIAARAAGIDTAVLKDWARRVLDESETVSARASEEPTILEIDTDTVRWNRQLSKAFDITEQQFKPASVEQDVAAKHCGCEIKELFHRELPVMSTRMGAFLVALDETLKSVTVTDIRNFNWKNEELPPLYERIQLNSTRAEEFLVDGTRFCTWNGAPLVLNVTPTWFGLKVTTYASKANESAATALVGLTQERAKHLNFLKGEAFSLSGEFLQRGTEGFADVFLSEENIAASRRVKQLLDEKGAQLDNRGVIMLGPPGNGKTLVGRILMNQAKATFIWCSARDFWHSGGFRGMADAFEIARECAPSIIFVEDVDNYLDGYTTDLMKTEMDGIAQSKGVVTILTTNYPELLPKALIDRPGRFHDILRFDLPDAAARMKMLAKWMPDLAGDALGDVVKALHGYSGAHVREFARFAGIIREQDGLDVAGAARKALKKLAEQRDLISQVQTQGSRYRAPEAIATKAKADDKARWDALVSRKGHAMETGRTATAKAAETADWRALAGVAVRLAADADRTDVARQYADAGQQAPWDRDAAAWKAFEKSAARLQRKQAEPLTDAQLADALADYGLDLEAAALKDVTVTVATDPGEEAAEAIAIDTVDTLLAQVADSVKNAQAQVKAYRAAQGGDAATEERIEDALVDALQAHVSQAIGTLGAVYALCCDMDEDDGRDDASDGLYGPSGQVGMALVKAIAHVDALREKLAGVRAKKGRVLSRANETMLKTAMAHNQASMDHVQAVLDSVAARDDNGDDNEPASGAGDEEDDAVSGADGKFLELASEPEDDGVIELDIEPVSPRNELIEVDTALFRQALKDAVDEIGAVAAREVRSQIDALRGRVTY